MRRELIFLPFILLLSCAAGPVPTPPEAIKIDLHCVEDRAAFMAMSYWEFDQSPEGVRSVLDKPGCRHAGADLIRDYHAALRAKGEPVTHVFPEGEMVFSDNGEVTMLYWHEGQARAMDGENKYGTELFRLSIEPAAKSYAGWNEYVRASIAFLEGDLDTLKAEREALSSKVGPGYGDLNLGVVDGLIACFGRSYKEAYGAPECNRRPGVAP